MDNTPVAQEEIVAALETPVDFNFELPDPEDDCLLAPRFATFLLSFVADLPNSVVSPDPETDEEP